MTANTDDTGTGPAQIAGGTEQDVTAPWLVRAVDGSGGDDLAGLDRRLHAGAPSQSKKRIFIRLAH